MAIFLKARAYLRDFRVFLRSSEGLTNLWGRKRNVHQFRVIPISEQGDGRRSRKHSSNLHPMRGENFTVEDGEKSFPTSAWWRKTLLRHEGLRRSSPIIGIHRDDLINPLCVACETRLPENGPQNLIKRRWNWLWKLGGRIIFSAVFAIIRSSYRVKTRTCVYRRTHHARLS